MKQEGVLDFEDEEEIEEYDEEEEDSGQKPSQRKNDDEYDEEEMDEEDARIKIVGGRVSDSLMNANDQQKALFFSVLVEWTLSKVQQSTGQGVFEKERISKYDEQAKLKVLNRYNELLDELASQNLDCEYAIVADLLLDVFRHKKNTIVDEVAVISDQKAAVKKGQRFTMKQFLQRIKSLEMQSMLEDLFKLVLKLREAKAFKSITTVTYFLVEAILTQAQSAMQAEMVNVVKYLLESMGKKTQNEAVGTAE